MLVHFTLRLCCFVMGGCLKGLPQVFNNTSYDVLTRQYGYVVRIIIIKLKNTLDFPLTHTVNEGSGVRDFTNDMAHDILYIDKVGLEDLITFHGAEFDIIDDYGFNSGRNDDKFNNVINNLYDLRIKLNSDNNKSCTGCY